MLDISRLDERLPLLLLVLILLFHSDELLAHLVLPRRIQIDLTNNAVDLGQQLWCQFVQCFQSCAVLHHLLRPRRPRDDGRHVLIFQAPCQCQLCPCDTQLVRDRLMIPKMACQLSCCKDTQSTGSVCLILELNATGLIGMA